MQIQAAATVDELQIVLCSQHVLDAVMACGYTKFVGATQLSDKEEIVKLLCVREVVLGSKSAIDQFIQGLDQVRRKRISVAWKAVISYTGIYMYIILSIPVHACKCFVLLKCIHLT